MQINASSHLNSYQSNSSLRSKTESSKNHSTEQSDETPSAQAEDKYTEQRRLQQLKSIDRAVRAHELAHQTVGGRYVTSGASFQYERGSDGRNYATSGEVSIDTSEIPGDPQATLVKAQVVLRAALAPVNPSSQDRQVAATATSMIQQARAALAQQSAANDSVRIGNQLDTYV